MKKLEIKTSGFTGTSAFFRADGTFEFLESETLPEGFLFGVSTAEEGSFSSPTLGTYVIKLVEGEAIIYRPILWVLDWFAGNFVTPMTLNAFDAEEGITFLDPLYAIDKTIGTGSMRIYDFVKLENGSMMTFEFAESSQSGALRDINVRVTNPAGVTNVYDTGENWRPRKAFGGYNRGENTFIFIEHKEGNDPITKRIMKLDNTFSAIGAYSFADAANLSTLVKTATGGVFVSGVGEFLSVLDESTMTVSNTINLDAYLVSVGYDAGGFCGKLLSDEDDLVYAIYSTWDAVLGDTRSVLLEYRVSTNTVLRHVEFDAPAFGAELGGISMAVHGGKVILVGNRNNGPNFSVIIVDLATFSVEPGTLTFPHDPDSGFYPWGTGYPNGDSKVFFGLDGGSAGVPFSLCLVYDVNTQTLSFTEFTPYASADTQLSPVLVTFVEVV